MRTHTRRVGVTTGGVALLLASLSSCGDGTSRAHAAPPATSVSVTSAPVATTHAEPLTQTELWKAVVTAEDLPGFHVGYMQIKGRPYQPGIPAARLPAVYPHGCAPVYWSTQAVSAYPITARIDADAGTTHTPEQFGSIALSVYSAADAPKAMTDLHNALLACAGAHIERHDPLASGISFSHPEVQPTARLGDDAVSFRLTQNVAGDDIDPGAVNVPMTFTVVRVGTTVITVWNMNTEDRTQPAVIAPQLAPAQVAKLTRYTHNSTTATG